VTATDARLLADVAAMDAALSPAPPVDTRALADAARADLRAWTVWQPWASAIVGRPGGCGGPKPVDNRPRRTNRRGPVLIHAARPGAYDHDAIARSAALRGWLLSPERPDRWVFGAIIGAAEITGCHQCHGSCTSWAEPGAWHVQLGWRIALDEPVACAGALGFWRPPPAVLAAVLEQLGAPS